MIETIKLLDGSMWDKKELINKMSDDDFYYEECGKTMLSSSICKNLLDSYKKYYYIMKYGSGKSRQPLIDGWLFHTYILEPDVFSKILFVDIVGKNTIKYKEAVKENPDVKVYTITEKKRAERLADAFLKNSKLVGYLNKADFEIANAGEIMGLPFRAKADIITKDGNIIDLKTTTNISQFKYSANTWNYDMQCYIYCNIFGITYDRFKIIGIDKDSLVSKYFSISEEFYLRGEAKLRKATDEYKNFVNTDLDEYLKTDTL